MSKYYIKLFRYVQYLQWILVYVIFNMYVGVFVFIFYVHTFVIATFTIVFLNYYLFE